MLPAAREDDRAGHEGGEVFGAFQFRDAVTGCAVVVGIELNCSCHSGSSPYDRRVVTPSHRTASRIDANTSTPVTCRPSCRVQRCGRLDDARTYTAPKAGACLATWIVVPGGSSHRLRSPVIGLSRPGMVMLILPAGGFAASCRALRASLMLLRVCSHAATWGMSLFTLNLRYRDGQWTMRNCSPADARSHRWS